MLIVSDTGEQVKASECTKDEMKYFRKAYAIMSNILLNIRGWPDYVLLTQAKFRQTMAKVKKTNQCDVDSSTCNKTRNCTLQT